MGRPPTICHIGVVGAVVGAGRVADAARFVPLRLIDVETCVAVGPRMHFRDFEAIGTIEPLPVDFGATDDRDLGGRTPQGVAARDRKSVV